MQWIEPRAAEWLASTLSIALDGPAPDEQFLVFFVQNVSILFSQVPEFFNESKIWVAANF